MVRELKAASEVDAIPEAASSETRLVRQGPRVRSLQTVTLPEAELYLQASRDDELAAALAIARDRAELAGSPTDPDEVEVHHSLFLLRRALGLAAPSFDTLHVRLRQREAA